MWPFGLRQPTLPPNRRYEQSDVETSSTAEMPSNNSEAVAEDEPNSKRRKTGLSGAFTTSKTPPEVPDVDYDRKTGLSGAFATSDNAPQVPDVDYDHMIAFFHPDSMHRLLVEAAHESPAIALAIRAHHDRTVKWEKKNAVNYKRHHSRLVRMLSNTETMDWINAWSMSHDITWCVQKAVRKILKRTREHVRFMTKKSALHTLVKIAQTLISKHGTVCGELVCENIALQEILEEALLQVANTLTDSQKDRFRLDKGWYASMMQVMQWGKERKPKLFRKIKDALRAIGHKVRDDETEEVEEDFVDKLFNDILDRFPENKGKAASKSKAESRLPPAE